jgi:AcrR family transcriptional regulator
MAKTTPYHHGDLQQALLKAGLELLQEHGLEGITLRETARRAGVSHAAPYHHFADKARLIEALATESFRRFTQALQEAWETTPGSSLARFRAVGLAYVQFALEHPAEFRLMNRPELRQPAKELQQDAASTPVTLAARQSYEVLLHSIRSCQEDGFITQGNPEPLALTAWSSVHGLAVLLMDGLLKEGAPSTEEGLGFADLVTQTLGHGLMAR